MTRFIVLDPESVLSFSEEDAIIGIDIETGFEDDDFLSVALPDFPLASIDTAASFIDLTSNPDGDFAAGPTDSVALSASTIPLVAGDSEFRCLRSVFSTIDLSAVTGVRFRISATALCDFRAMAVRLISKDWKYAPLDRDTLYNKAIRPVSLDGAASPTYAFPEAPSPYEPPEWPIIWHSDDPAGLADPRPINLSVTSQFHTGGLTEATTLASAANALSLFFREVSLDQPTQLDLDGGTFDQADLDSLGHQPDIMKGHKHEGFDDLTSPLTAYQRLHLGQALYTNRKQSDLQGLSQASLDQETQFDLERLPDYLSASYVEVALKWAADGAELRIKDTNGNEITYTGFTLNANSYYALWVDLEEEGLRARIITSDSVGDLYFDNVIFDSTTVINPVIFARRKGRFGWWASLLDGDAHIKNIRPRRTCFAEYRSHAFRSDTPVAGVSVFAGSTPDRELFDGWNPGLWGGSVDLDASKSNSGKAVKVAATAATPLQGIMTNKLYIDNFDETEINFDVFFPRSAFDASVGLSVFLFGELGRIVPLHLPTLRGDKWEHVKIYPMQGQRVQTGYYRLVIVQSASNAATTWYVDNASIRTRAVKWEARGQADDAWQLGDDAWIPLNGTLNTTKGGVLFPERGNTAQVRACALAQDAQIDSLKVVPKYAELGRLVWRDQRPTLDSAVEAFFTSTPVGREVTFDGTGSEDPSRSENPLVGFYWTLGDGTVSTGRTTTHTYEKSGTYRVTLVVIDNTGNSDSVTADVTV